MGKQLYIGQYMVSSAYSVIFYSLFTQVRLENLFDDALTVDLEEFLSWAAPGTGRNIEVISLHHGIHQNDYNRCIINIAIVITTIIIIVMKLNEIR